MVDGIESDVRWGPQPYIGVLSEICESFGCTPDVAERQDWQKVKSILDYRAAKAAVSLFNGGKQGLEALLKQPHLQELLLEMHRAQSGIDVTMDQVLETARDDSDG